MFEFLTKPQSGRMDTVEKTESFSDTGNEKQADTEKLINSFRTKNILKGSSIVKYSLDCLSLIAREKEISQGAFFLSVCKEGKPGIRFIAGFASPDPEDMEDILELGEGFHGQVAKDGRLINISNIPEGYLPIATGLGKAAPVSLIVFPVKDGDKVVAVIELASFHRFTKEDEYYFESIAPFICEKLIKCTSNS